MDNGSIELLHFSDSIIVVAHKADIFTLNRLVKIATILLQIGLESQFAMKGAIARGKKGKIIFNSLSIWRLEGHS